MGLPFKTPPLLLGQPWLCHSPADEVNKELLLTKVGSFLKKESHQEGQSSGILTHFIEEVNMQM